MKTKIDITKYVHVDEIYWGQECKSSDSCFYEFLCNVIKIFLTLLLFEKHLENSR